MTQETEIQLQQEVMRLQEEQRILGLKKRLKREEEYRYLMILLGQEANQFREKIVTQLNSISQQLYDHNKVLANNNSEEVEGEEVPDIEAKEIEEDKDEEQVEEPEEEVPDIEAKEIEEVKGESKEQKKIRKEIKKLEKKVTKFTS